MTAHSSKGLEYDFVFIPGLHHGNWDGKAIRDKLKLPARMIGQGLQANKASQLEEDRRLFFVALTRARLAVFLSHPLGEGNKALLQSQFLQEIEDFTTKTAFEIENEEEKTAEMIHHDL